MPCGGKRSGTHASTGAKQKKAQTRGQTFFRKHPSQVIITIKSSLRMVRHAALHQSAKRASACSSPVRPRSSVSPRLHPAFSARWPPSWSLLSFNWPADIDTWWFFHPAPSDLPSAFRSTRSCCRSPLPSRPPALAFSPKRSPRSSSCSP